MSKRRRRGSKFRAVSAAQAGWLPVCVYLFLQSRRLLASNASHACVTLGRAHSFGYELRNTYTRESECKRVRERERERERGRSDFDSRPVRSASAPSAVVVKGETRPRSIVRSCQIEIVTFEFATIRDCQRSNCPLGFAVVVNVRIDQTSPGLRCARARVYWPARASVCSQSSRRKRTASAAQRSLIDTRARLEECQWN